jgi:hypothetical protein
MPSSGIQFGEPSTAKMDGMATVADPDETNTEYYGNAMGYLCRSTQIANIDG